MKKRRLLSIVISLCMVLALMPQMVFAEEPTRTPLTKDNVTDGVLGLENGNSYYLSEDIDITRPIIIDGTVTLDLNGYKISMTSRDSVIKVENNGELTLQDNSEGKTGMITGGHTSSSGGGVFVSYGSFVMESGTIYNCSASSIGGGVFVTAGSFTMKGGIIYDCYAGEGGSVATDGGIFTMEGGIIDSGNEFVSNDIIVYTNSTFNANGGVVKSFVNSYGQINNTTTYGGTIFYGDSNRFGTINGKTVTFKKDDSTYATEIVAEDNKAAVPEAPTREGYKFTGWYTDETFTNQYNFEDYVTGNITLYAGWEEEKITLTVPFTTTVELGGNVAPGETTFNLQVLDSSGEKLSSDDVEIEITSVKTNGAGSYDGTLTIDGTSEDIANMLMDGVFVKQAEGKYKNWEVDDTVWGLVWQDEVVALASADSAATDNSIFIFPAEYVETENGGYYKMVEGEEAVDKMTFINTYTKSATGPSDSDDTNGDADNADKSAKTGDDANLALWLALLLLSGAGITGAGIYTRRKRTNE